MRVNSFFKLTGMCIILCFIMLTVFGQQSPKLSDAEIVHVAVTANQIDIGYAKIAKERSKHTDIVKFAQTMLDDHAAIIAQAAALVKKLRVVPKDNNVSKKLLSDAAKTKKIEVEIRFGF